MVTQAGSGGQHKHHGGVAWRAWGDEAFRLARELDRPILLDISAVWCHWCHVMDQTSYSDPDVITLIERDYIAIRVDNDQRPDINERYNMGGWPTTAFLTPSGDLLTGGTYIAPEQMRSTLVRVADYYRRNRQAINDKTAAERRQPAAALPSGDEAALSPSIVSDVLASLRDNFDAEHGGLGSAPKFPHPDSVELALRDVQRSNASASLPLVTRTLNAMAAGGIYDRVEGGFFRYATMRDWSIPHFEKMLEGNAGQLANYLRACQVTGESLYANVARDIIRYVNTVLSDQQAGGFYGSQDADEQYYALPLDERRKRPAPYVDRTLYTDWNAMMSSAYLLAAAVLDDASLEQFALLTVDRLWQLCWQPQGGIHHYHDGQARLPGLLADQAHMGIALLDAYQATGASVYLARAAQLAGFCLAVLGDAAGGFRDAPEQPGAPGHLKTPLVPLPGNAAAARLLLRLAWLTGDDAYRQAAQRTLARFTLVYERLGFFAAPYALAVDELLRPPLKIVIVGDADNEQLALLRGAALRLPEPWKLVQTLDPQRDAQAFARSGFPAPSQPLAYPCIGATCLAPISDPARLADLGRRDRVTR